LSGSGFLRRPQLERRDFALADHTFSRSVWRQEVEDATRAWLTENFPAVRGEGAAKNT
jgi:hypothetical protein